MKKQVAVIGIGEFGMSVMDTLLEEGVEVMALDADEEKIQEVSDRVQTAVCIDTTDERALRKVGITEMDAVVIAMGTNLQSSILTALLCKELGIKEIVAKAMNRSHGKLLERIGADRIVYPEAEMGVRIARSLSSKNLLEQFELSDEFTIAEIQTPDSLAGFTIKDADLRAKYGVNVIAVKRVDGKSDFMEVAPKPDFVMKSKDILFLFGRHKDIEAFKDL